MARKQRPSETRIARSIEQILSGCIPPGWSLRAETETPAGRYRVDLLAEITSPSNETTVLAIEIKRHLDPLLVPKTAEQISMITAETLRAAVPVLAAA